MKTILFLLLFHVQPKHDTTWVIMEYFDAAQGGIVNRYGFKLKDTRDSMVYYHYRQRPDGSGYWAIVDAKIIWEGELKKPKKP